MKMNLFRRLLRLEERKSVSGKKSVASKRRKRTLIPDGYYVITTIPGRKPVIEKD